MKRILTSQNIITTFLLVTNGLLIKNVLDEKGVIKAQQAMIDAAEDDKTKLRSEITAQAKKDKTAAIEQMVGATANLFSDFDTAGFEALENKYPWMKGLHRSVGQTIASFEESPDKSVIHFGSVILLDNDGTVVMTEHQRHAETSMFVSFIKPGNPYGNQLAIGSVTDIRYNQQYDVAFGTLHMKEFSDVETAGLSPVQWGSSPQDVHISKGIIAVGFAWPSFRFHATQGSVTGPEDHVLTKSGHHYSCKVEMDNLILHGMSGGASFEEDNGIFDGLNNLGTDLGADPRSSITPAAFIRAAYIELYPNRANKAGVKKQPLDGLPPSCRMLPTFLNAGGPAP